MGLNIPVGCSFSASEGLAVPAFADDLGGEDERSSANGGASEVPLWLRVLRERARKVPPMASVDTRGQNPPFFPHPNMPRFWNRGRISKTTGAKSPYCTNVSTCQSNIVSRVKVNLLYSI